MSALSLIAAAVLAASPQAGAPADSARMSLIWDAFNERLRSQTDIWFDEGQFPRSIQGIRIQYAMHPDSYEILTNLGWMLENVERWSDALALYVAFRKRHPNDAEAYYPEAQFYSMKKVYSKVPPLLEPTLKMRVLPHPNTYRILARAYEQLGLLADAKRVYTLLLERLPGDPATKNNLNRIERKIKGGNKA